MGHKKPRSVDEIEEELEAEFDPPWAPSTRRKQIPANAKKLPNKQKTASTMPDALYVERRKENPYVVERMHLIPSIRGNDPRFHTVFQAQCYRELLMTEPSGNVVPQHSINMGHIERNPEYFSKALSLVDELGIRPLMTFSQNFDEALVC